MENKNRVLEGISNLRSYNLEILPTLNSLSSPLKDKFNLSFLTFRRLYANGRIIHISNHKDWLENSLSNKFWQSMTSLKRINSINLNQQYAHLWDENAYKKDHVYNAMYENDLWHGITIYDKHDSYVDLWAFATDRSNYQIKNLYVNRLNILKQFILYLHDKAHPIFFPNNIDLSISTNNIFSINKEYNNIEEVINLFGINKYYIDHKTNVYLTSQEFKCLYHLSNGKSVKEIASILRLSPRTAECHINSIKLKTNSQFKCEIIKNCNYILNMYK
jgi:DNA-binding CsgD family transcriptional regulator